MIYVEEGLYVTIAEDTSVMAPQPRPLQHQFSPKFAYRVLGAFSLAESAEAFFIMANNRDEIWFISNRHLRVHSVKPEARDFRLPLAGSAARALSSSRNGTRKQSHHLAKIRANGR